MCVRERERHSERERESERKRKRERERERECPCVYMMSFFQKQFFSHFLIALALRGGNTRATMCSPCSRKTCVVCARESACACVCERERASVFVCDCVYLGERERERESVSVSVCVFHRGIAPALRARGHLRLVLCGVCVCTCASLLRATQSSGPRTPFCCCFRASIF